MKNQSYLKFLAYRLSAKNSAKANVAHDLLINNIRKENPVQDRSKSGLRHISEIIRELNYHVDNRTL